MAEENLEELIAAWESWDKKPKSSERVARRHSALKAITDDWLALHRRIDQLRRSGLTARQAIATALEPGGQV